MPFGYGPAVLASGHTTLAVIFLLACVFGMFYTPSGSYWAVTFFITGSLSMVLAVLRTLSPELLALRGAGFWRPRWSSPRASIRSPKCV